MDNAIEPDNSRRNEVQDWVKITKAPPQKVVQKLGESVEVECEIMGSPAPFVEWFEGRYPPDSEVSFFVVFLILYLGVASSTSFAIFGIYLNFRDFLVNFVFV